LVHRELAAPGPFEVLAWALKRRTRVRVRGTSMSPTLADGDEVLIARVRTARPGDLVCVRHPFRSDLQLIKRLTSVDGGLTVAGDNPDASSDSRTLGVLPADHLVGRVTSRLP